jgi:hypothetical protein
MDKIALTFEDYNSIFNYLLNREDNYDVIPNRLVFSEWIKFSLQLSIEDEVTRRNVVSLMFTYIGQPQHSYQDYMYLLKYKRIMIRDCDARTLDLAMEGEVDL